MKTITLDCYLNPILYTAERIMNFYWRQVKDNMVEAIRKDPFVTMECTLFKPEALFSGTHEEEADKVIRGIPWFYRFDVLMKMSVIMVMLAMMLRFGCLSVSRSGSKVGWQCWRWHWKDKFADDDIMVIAWIIGDCGGGDCKSVGSVGGGHRRKRD